MILFGILLFLLASNMVRNELSNSSFENKSKRNK